MLSIACCSGAAAWSQWAGKGRVGRAGAAERKAKASSILYLKQVLTGMPQGGWEEKEGVTEDSQHLVSCQRESI